MESPICPNSKVKLYVGISAFHHPSYFSIRELSIASSAGCFTYQVLVPDNPLLDKEIAGTILKQKHAMQSSIWTSCVDALTQTDVMATILGRAMECNFHWEKDYVFHHGPPSCDPMHYLLKQCGFKNVFSVGKMEGPVVTEEFWARNVCPFHELNTLPEIQKSKYFPECTRPRALAYGMWLGLLPV
jgi:hypothetical protein